MSVYSRWAQRQYTDVQKTTALLFAGPVFLGLLPFVIGSVGPRLDRRLGLPSFRIPVLSRLVGGMMLVAGFSFAFWSVIAEIGRGRGTPLPVMPTQELLTDGPFRYCRNPMTLGTLVAYKGIGVGVGTLTGTLLVAGCGAALLAYLKRFEEPELEERFGQAYVEYKRDVPFVIPRCPER